ncbi:hypothetical protein Taro_035720 [Colocasia esculenta]|uniref:DUF4219 domain-containing protein n=1 Tax=Colocasia esculenta TaxID=4460 RepID=A0A843WBB4_COLES|nr:hypothetical protein [Colocasia esculenta]
MASEAHNYEGQSVTRPPFFDGEDYQYWKMRMECFIRGTDFDLWQVIEQGDFQVLVESSSGALSIADKRNMSLNYKAKNYLCCALSKRVFNRLSACKTAKEMWDKLQVTYEGTDSVKQTRIDILVSQYEQFKMLPNENITQMYNRFSNIIVDSSSSEDSKEKLDDSDDEAILSRKLQRILAKKKKFGSRKFFKKDKKKEPTCY